MTGACALELINHQNVDYLVLNAPFYSSTTKTQTNYENNDCFNSSTSTTTTNNDDSSTNNLLNYLNQHKLLLNLTKTNHIKFNIKVLCSINRLNIHLPSFDSKGMLYSVTCDII